MGRKTIELPRYGRINQLAHRRHPFLVLECIGGIMLTRRARCSTEKNEALNLHNKKPPGEKRLAPYPAASSSPLIHNGVVDKRKLKLT
jgi:hypothetical protein